MAERIRTKKGSQARQRIVDAATEVVSQKGAVVASLDDIGLRAHASRSQIYHYFDDKADLMRAVAESTNDVVVGSQHATLDGVDTWTGFANWAQSLVTLQVELGGRGGCPIANLVCQLGEHNDGIRITLASGLVRWEAEIRNALVAMVSAGELLAETDVDWLATSTLASVQGGLLLTQAQRDPRALSRALDGALTLIATCRVSN